MISVLLAFSLFMSISVVSINTFAYTYNDLTYIISDGEITINDCNENAVGVMVVPDQIDGYPVTAIGREAFYYCSRLTEIHLPESIKSIGSGAFHYCSSLQKINLPKNATDIGGSLFGENSTFIQSVGPLGGGYDCEYGWTDSIPRNVFSGSNISRVVFSKGITSIGIYSFGNCNNLKTIEIPDSVISIGNSAFNGCSYLESVSFENGLETIGNYAFNGCRRLISVDLPDSVTSIGIGAFGECRKLKTIKLPSEISTISNSLFYRCYELSDVTIPESVTSIGESAFNCCTNLEEVYIHRGITSIGSYAFCGCGNVKSMIVDEDNLVYHSAGNCIIETGTKKLMFGCQNSLIPDDGSVTSINEGAFYFCLGLKNITIPNSITEIGEGAFSDCLELESVVLPTGIQEIKDHTFHSCDKLESVTIPEGVITIGEYAFTSCTCIKELYLPKSLKSIAESAFNLSLDPDWLYYMRFDYEYAVSNGYDRLVGEYLVFEWPLDMVEFWLNNSESKLTDVYYNGTSAEWNKIEIADNNDDLLNATIHKTDDHTHLYSEEIIKEATCTESGEKRFTCECGDTFIGTIKPLGHSFTNYKYNNDATTERDGTETAKCDRCTEIYTRTKPGTRIENPTANARINVGASRTVDYRSKVTITATADNVPSGYFLAIYDGNSIVKRGNNRMVTYEAGEMTATKTYTVKVIDTGRNVQKDAGNNPLEKDIKVEVKSGFFDKIIALFKGWFNLLPTVEIKP